MTKHFGNMGGIGTVGQQMGGSSPSDGMWVDV
jgi:hypothetical protein